MSHSNKRIEKKTSLILRTRYSFGIKMACVLKGLLNTQNYRNRFSGPAEVLQIFFENFPRILFLRNCFKDSSKENPPGNQNSFRDTFKYCFGNFSIFVNTYRDSFRDFFKFRKFFKDFSRNSPKTFRNFVQIFSKNTFKNISSSCVKHSSGGFPKSFCKHSSNDFLKISSLDFQESS